MLQSENKHTPWILVHRSQPRNITLSPMDKGLLMLDREIYHKIFIREW